jgi:aspartyl-tRNA(Asn)/glutamyl-tRNA(Gln) amidotransferase subunit A
VTEIHRLSARELLEGYRARTFSPSEVLEALIARIEAVEPLVNAFTTLALERARAEAARADAAWRRPDDARVLEGVPIGVKDLFDSEGIRTTYGSAMFADNVPSADAAVIARVRAAGAVVVGKTATHEFGWGITTNNPHYGPTCNPWARDRIPGGSSGGSAVALATGELPLAIGSDTGGSIRIPASFCGVAGLKPTWGRISAAGAITLARTLDHPGPMARDPHDVALLYGVLAGFDAADPASEDRPVELPGEPASLDGLRLGVQGSVAGARLLPAVDAILWRAAATASELGAQVEDVELHDGPTMLDTFVTTQRAEAFAYHRSRGLYPARAGEYGDDVRGRLEVAAGVQLADYLAAAAERQRIHASFVRVFQTVDLLLTPISAIAPPPIGAETVLHEGVEQDVRALVMTYTVPQDLDGLPTCVVRAGQDGDGLPVGIQITGPRWSERTVLSCACAISDALAVASTLGDPVL